MCKGIYINKAEAQSLGFNPECIDNVGAFGSTWNVDGEGLCGFCGELTINGVTTSKGVTLFSEILTNSGKYNIGVRQAIDYGKGHQPFHSTIYGGMFV